MLIIPLLAEKHQTFSTTLGSQNCEFAVYQKSTGLYIDVIVDGAPLVYGMLCRDRVKLIRHEYLRFDGELFFADISGRKDPEYSGLGGRYQLIYVAADEL